MAYDPELADRLRDQLEGTPTTEKRMFGGLAFLVGGNMAVAASSHGGLRLCTRQRTRRGHGGLGRGHRFSVDVEAIPLHLHAIAGQADDPLHVVPGAIVGVGEDDHIPPPHGTRASDAGVAPIDESDVARP